MAGTNRVGRVSSIDYESGTYEVTYADQGRRVTARINAMSNGEYKMPRVGQIVSVTHTSNGTAAATTSGTVWNRSNRPAEGFAGLYRKEYGEKAGQAFERYDANTGIYTQYTDVRTGRNCNGDIFDEAKGTISLIAEKLVQITSKIKCLGNGFAWIWCSYVLAYLGREQIAETLSSVAVKEIIGVVLAYAIKSVLENLSKNNHWPDKPDPIAPTAVEAEETADQPSNDL